MRIDELEASERELHAANHMLREELDGQAAAVAVLSREFETGAMGSGTRARIARITHDLPAAAREHLARDTEREKTLELMRAEIAEWIGLAKAIQSRYGVVLGRPMPERPDLHLSADKVEAAVERLRVMAKLSDPLPLERDVALVLARLEELEGEWSQMGIGARWFFRAEAAEADARAMREAIWFVVRATVEPLKTAPQVPWCHSCKGVATPHRSDCPAAALGAAALRGWYPGWYA